MTIPAEQNIRPVIVRCQDRCTWTRVHPSVKACKFNSLSTTDNLAPLLCEHCKHSCKSMTAYAIGFYSTFKPEHMSLDLASPIRGAFCRQPCRTEIQPHVALCFIISASEPCAFVVWADKGLQLTNGSDYRDLERDLSLYQALLQYCRIYHWHVSGKKQIFYHSTARSYSNQQHNSIIRV